MAGSQSPADSSPRPPGSVPPSSVSNGGIPSPPPSEEQDEKFSAAAAAAVGRSPRRTVAWVVVGIFVALMAVLAGLYVVQTYFPGLHTPIRAAPPAKGEEVDLCNLSRGTNCMGGGVSLPTTTSGGALNTSACDAVPVQGSREQLWLNFSDNGPGSLEGVVLPATLYTGGPPSWYLSPWILLNDSSDVHAAIWLASISPAVSESIVVTVPSTAGSLCLGWWAPGGTAQLVWATDVTVTYVSGS